MAWRLPPWSHPGYSVHRELELLVRAGLTPMEALEAATRRAAEMLDVVDEFGTIEPGKRADLLILTDNPLEDIRNTRTLEAVIAEGRLVDRVRCRSGSDERPEEIMNLRVFPAPCIVAGTLYVLCPASALAQSATVAIQDVTVVDVADGSRPDITHTASLAFFRE